MREVRTYLIAYVPAPALTGTAVAAVRWLSVGAGAIFAIVPALVLVAVQFRCSSATALRASARGNLQLILFSTLIRR